METFVPGQIGQAHAAFKLMDGMMNINNRPSHQKVERQRVRCAPWHAARKIGDHSGKIVTDCENPYTVVLALEVPCAQFGGQPSYVVFILKQIRQDNLELCLSG